MRTVTQKEADLAAGGKVAAKKFGKQAQPQLKFYL